jgi:preprotein translocase subunit YajC
MLILVLAVSFIFLFGIAKEIAKSMDRIEEIQNHMKGGK